MRHHAWILKTSRLEALFDGIFTIAMTILILNVNLPTFNSSINLLQFLQTDIIYKLFIFAGSFIILGTYWVGVNFHYGLLSHINRTYLWINIFFLMLVCIVPFSANLLARFPANPVSICFYAINLLLISFSQLIAWWYALKKQLVNKTTCTPAVIRSLYSRICSAPVFYVIALFLADWNTLIAFIALLIPPIIHIFPGKIDQLVIEKKIRADDISSGFI